MQKLQKGSFLQLHIDFIHELFDHDQINWPGVRLVDTPQYIHMLNFFSSLSLLNLLDLILFLKAIQPHVSKHLGTQGICASELLEPKRTLVPGTPRGTKVLRGTWTYLLSLTITIMHNNNYAIMHRFCLLPRIGQ